MLNCLILSDRPPEHDALFGIGACARQRSTAQSDGFGSDQDPLRIKPVQEILEAAALFADPIRGRHRQAVDEQLIGVTALRPIFAISRTST